MLYIEKRPCPQEIADEIALIKGSELWDDIHDPADHDLSDDDRHNAVEQLRAHFNQLHKNAVRNALISEQHGLCAYCMSRINDNGLETSIEHWSPLSKRKQNALDYNNFLAVCQGGKTTEILAAAKRILCCDAHKDDEAEMKLDPRNEQMMEGIIYNSEGIVDYRDSMPLAQEVARHDLDKVLQLNGILGDGRSCKFDTATKLVQQRRNAYRHTEEDCLRHYDDGTLTVEWLQSQIDKCLNQEQRQGFIGVDIFVYKQYIAKLLKKQNGDNRHG